MAVLAPRKADLRTVGDGPLAAMAAGGDESAFEAIFERHHRGLLSMCRHLLGSLEEAEDALQHTFAAAYRQLTEGEPPEHLRAWLYRTARNRCTDILRARRELPAAAPEVSTAGLPEEVERRSDLRELVSDIGRLPDDQRAALVLSEIEDLGHAEVAEVLGCRRDKVRALVYQARSSLAGWREARQLPCREVREEIAVAHGGGLRRAHLRRHLKVCAGCAAFRKDMDRQRRRVALLLPVLAAPGLKERVLEAALGAARRGGVARPAVAGAAGGARRRWRCGEAAARPAEVLRPAGGAAAGPLGATALKIGASVLVLGGAGVATFGGLFGGGDRGPGQAPDAPPARPASADAREDEARRDERRARLEERARRLRLREQSPAPASEAIEPASGSEPESLEPAPAPTQGSPSPGPAPAPPESPPAGGQSPPQSSPDSGQTPPQSPPGGGQPPSPSPQPAPAPAPPPAESPPEPPGIEAEIEAQLPPLP